MAGDGLTRRALLGGGLVAAGGIGASAVWAVESSNDSGGTSAPAAAPSLRVWDVGQLGDSITNQGVAPSLAKSISAGSCVFGPLSYLGAALPLTNGRFRFGGNWSTPGFTSRQIRDTHLPRAVAARPAVCVILAGTNDIGKLSPAETKRNITALIDELQQVGTLPILATLPPYNPRAGEQLGQHTALNIWLRHTARQRGLPLADFNAALINPSTGLYRDGLPVEDGIHPSSAGARVMGIELARVLNGIPGQAPAPLLTSATEAALLVDVCQTRSDVWKPAGPPTAGSYTQQTGDGWLGNKGVITARGSAAYFLVGSMAPPPPAGHRIQLAFVLDVAAVPDGGTWSCLLLDSASNVALCGYFECDQPLTNATGNPISVWEFDMPDVPKDSSLAFTYSVKGAAGVSVGCAQVSAVDLTALGID